MLVTIVSWILTFITLVAIGSLITKFKNKKWIISMIIILLIIILGVAMLNTNKKILSIDC